MNSFQINLRLAIHKGTLVKYLMSRDRKIKQLQKQLDDIKKNGLSNDMKKGPFNRFQKLFTTKIIKKKSTKKIWISRFFFVYLLCK